MKKQFALIGQNISYSLSPQIHNIIYKFLNQSAEYSLIDIAKGGLPDKIELLKKLDGFNVTQPHKNDIAAFLKTNKSQFSAVNTVKVVGNELYGYNTDGYGILKAIKKHITLKDKTALILGAGGVAEVAAKVCANDGAKVFIFNRTSQKAKSLAESIKNAAPITADKIAETNFDIVINCSSAELYGEIPSVYDNINFKAAELIYDTIYKQTEFQRLANLAGVKTENGLSMLIYQAIKADSIFLDKTFTAAEEENLFSEIFSELTN